MHADTWENQPSGYFYRLCQQSFDSNKILLRQCQVNRTNIEKSRRRVRCELVKSSITLQCRKLGLSGLIRLNLKHSVTKLSM